VRLRALCVLRPASGAGTFFRGAMQPAGMDGLVERAVMELLLASDGAEFLPGVQGRLHPGQDFGREHGGAPALGRPPEPARPLRLTELHRALDAVLAHPEHPHEVRLLDVAVEVKLAGDEAETFHVIGAVAEDRQAALHVGAGGVLAQDGQVRGVRGTAPCGNRGSCSCGMGGSMAASRSLGQPNRGQCRIPDARLSTIRDHGI